MKIKVVVGIALVLFTIIIGSIGVAGLVLYDQKKNVGPAQKLASTDLSISDQNPSVQSNSELGGISAEVVSSHSSSSDCWMIIDGNVYDFTKFLNIHPGTSATMLPYCGRDGSNAFATKDKNPGTAHTSIARDLLGQYYLGTLGNGSGSNLAQNPTIPGTNSKLTPTTRPGTTIPTGSTTNVPASSSSNILTTATVSAHSSSSDCWIIISGNVYAVSGYLNSHPGGAGVIANYCGRDASNAFATKDRNPGSSHSSFAVSQLSGLLVGRIGTPVTGSGNTGTNTAATPTPTQRINNPTPTTIPGGGGGGGGGGSVTLTTTQVSAHNTLQDCWMIISNRVYNLTGYIAQHPGGQNAILNYCGRDGTNAFDTRGGSGTHSNNARNLLNGFYIGDLGTSVPVGSTPTPTPLPGSATSTPIQNTSQVPSVVLQKYPDATLRGEIEYEDDGRMELKITTSGQCRDIKINSSGVISEDKSC